MVIDAEKRRPVARLGALSPRTHTRRSVSSCCSLCVCGSVWGAYRGEHTHTHTHAYSTAYKVRARLSLCGSVWGAQAERRFLRGKALNALRCDTPWRCKAVFLSHFLTHSSLCSLTHFTHSPAIYGWLSPPLRGAASLLYVLSQFSKSKAFGSCVETTLSPSTPPSRLKPLSILH